MEYDLELRPTGRFRSKGEQYEAIFADEILATGTSPEYSACRALQDRGLSGSARFWRKGAKAWAIKMDIAAGAKRTVVENAKIGPREGKWVPFDRDELD